MDDRLDEVATLILYRSLKQLRRMRQCGVKDNFNVSKSLTGRKSYGRTLLSYSIELNNRQSGASR